MGLFDFFKRFGGDKASAGKPGAPVKQKLQVVDLAKRFEMSARLGQGSMSKVWRAYDRKLGRTICLKILDPVKTARFEARFAGLHKPSEGEICMLLKHKQIVQSFEYGISTQKEPYVVMELIEGLGLNFIVETRGKQLEEHRVDYLIQMAGGLDYIHRAGFLHRDICPRNVMVTTDGVVKVIDVGLTIPYKPEFCRPGNRTGTTNYLAPELIQRKPTDHRVDLFALGVTAYEIFTGQMPWEKAPSEKLLRSMVNSPARDPLEHKPDLDAEVAAFLRKAVERDPRDRYQSASEFREALRALSVK